MVSLVLWDDKGPDVAPFGKITFNLNDSFGIWRKRLRWFLAIGIAVS